MVKLKEIEFLKNGKVLFVFEGEDGDEYAVMTIVPIESLTNLAELIEFEGVKTKRED